MNDFTEPVWKRQANEPAKWFSRFETYLALGPERGVHIAFERVRQQRITAPANQWLPPPGAYRSWLHIANTWHWAARADACDDYNREQLSLRNEQRRIDERETRLKIITQQMHLAETALLSCNLDTLSTDEARTLLPTLRLLLRDMLEQQRIDVEPLRYYDTSDDRAVLTFTADELVAVTRELADTELSWGLGTPNNPAPSVESVQREQEL